jgi:hypothetical protein
MWISPLALSNLRKYFWRLLATALLSAPTALGQVGGIDSDPGDRGTGGQNTIQGTILVST